MSALSLRQMYIDDKYIVMHTIGSGHFGDIRIAKDLETGDAFAVKLEDSLKYGGKLENEMKFYEKIKRAYLSLTGVCDVSQEQFPEVYGFPEVYQYGTLGSYNYLLMELLGFNLETLFNSCGRKFTMKCVIMIGLQLLSRLEFIHSCNIVFRDIKPENFVVGKVSKNGGTVIYMVDFGLASDIAESGPVNHLTRKLVGTARYMSVNAHKGKDQSPRDDLESLAYILIYFGKGSLPWQGIVSHDIHEKYRKISEIKSSTHTSVLCKGLPNQFHKFVTHIRLLHFEEKPNYPYLQELLRDVLKSRSEICNWIFDWDVRGSIIQASVDNTLNTIISAADVKTDDLFCSSSLDNCKCCCIKKSKSQR